MSVLLVVVNANTGTRKPSPYGPATFSTSSAASAGGRMAAVLPNAGGAEWCIFKVQNTDLPAGEVINQVALDITQDFQLANDEAPRRKTTGYWKIARSLAEFTPTAPADGVFGDQVDGTGVSHHIMVLASKAGYTTDDVRAGNFYLGFSVNSNYTSPGFGNGTYRLLSNMWTFYTGTDIFYPLATSPAGYITNAAENTAPGKIPGARFISVGFTLTQVLPQPTLSFLWTLSSTFLKFVSNNLQTMSQPKGTTGDPTFPYAGATGDILIDVMTPPGTYSIKVACQGPANATFNATTNLVVAPLPTSLLHEF